MPASFRERTPARKGRVPKPVRSGGIGDELEAEAAPGGGAAWPERGRREPPGGARGEVDDHELPAAVGGEEEGASGGGEEVEVLAGGHGRGEDRRDRDAEPPPRGPVEATDGGVAGRELLEEEQPRGGRAGPRRRRGEVVEAAEVRGGDEAGERARHGAHAEELRDGEAEEDLVQELRREQQQRAQRRGRRARRRGVVLAGEGVVGHGRG